MNYISFNLFVSCYIYGSIGYISILFILHLYFALLAISDEQETVNQTVGDDFYSQVKELLNPAIEDVFDPLPSPLESDFSLMTIRELRSHIRDNKLQEQILSLTGKTVSNARKHELVAALS